MNIQPRPRLVQGTAGGSVSALILAVIGHRFGIEFTPEEYALAAIAFGFLSGWLMPGQKEE